VSEISCGRLEQLRGAQLIFLAPTPHRDGSAFFSRCSGPMHANQFAESRGVTSRPPKDFAAIDLEIAAPLE
jgi:hypothetical protein